MVKNVEKTINVGASYDNRIRYLSLFYMSNKSIIKDRRIFFLKYNETNQYTSIRKFISTTNDENLIVEPGYKR